MICLAALHSLRIAPAELDATLRARLGQPLRREGVFARLSLAGIAACLGEPGVPWQGKRNGLIYGSRRGAAAETERVLAEVAGQGSLPMPFDFIASQAGVAAAQAARIFGDVDGAMYLPSTGALWEQILNLALLWLESGRYEQVLCGWVEPAWPAQDNAPGVHCSDWLLLAPKASFDTGWARLERVASASPLAQGASEADFVPALVSWMRGPVEPAIAPPACGALRWVR